ncbi:MAG TPA: Asp-tRNA(Asn)/Glu-tRNA(Gln) amidotransferase subunit GatA [Candidatus Bathyarchaeia archaeon]|nr:Asp-tRNA(Asn)/Glu-tRNA(Gln) amidotransferase subunit GatA [Candidatus Bathyarchaeia archaeon]
MKLFDMTLFQALRGLRKRRFSSFELTKACFSRIGKIDKKIKAFITVCRQQALDKARDTDRLIAKTGWDLNQLLLGIPIAIKDNFCTKNLRTTAASNVLANYVPVYDATVIERLNNAGAILLGKTNMDAWAHGSSTETSDFFTTRNPWDQDKLPGGSSGGSAAAVIADETITAVGSETAGSIRQPASWCGIVGLKPTYGRVSRYGLIAMGSSLDCPGPMTKSVEDAALVLQVLAGEDQKDATLSPRLVPDYLSTLKSGIRGIKFGVPKQYFSLKVDKEVLKGIRSAIMVLKKLGCTLKPISLLDPEFSVAVYTILQRSEVSSNLARYDGVRYGYGRNKFGEEAKRRIMLGTYALSHGYYDQYYLKAQKVRTLICEDFASVFREIDLIVAPTTPCPALKIGSSKNSPMFGEMQDILVEPSTLAGLPGISVPCGFSKDGLPIGMQIIGPQFSESLVLRAAYAYEQATTWHLRKPKLD